MIEIACVECRAACTAQRRSRKFCSAICTKRWHRKQDRKTYNANARNYRAKNLERMRWRARVRTAIRKTKNERPNPLTCTNCEKHFFPRDKRQKCCSKKCGSRIYDASFERRAQPMIKYRKNRAKICAERRRRYAADEKYRRKIVEGRKALQKMKPEHIRAIRAKSRAKPVHRAKAVIKSKKWHAANREYANPRRIERKQRQRLFQPWTISILSAKGRARDFGLPFDLTNEWAKARWTGECELTGIPFTLGARGSSGKLRSPSIDKITPGLGYVQSNCRFILHCVNMFKYTGTDADIYEIAAALLKNRKI